MQKAMQRWYTRVIGILSCLMAIPVIIYAQHSGINLEVFLKAVYIIVGIFATYWGFWGSQKECKTFTSWHGLTFLVIGILGWISPGLGNMPTFYQPEIAIHTVIGIAGIFFGTFK